MMMSHPPSFSDNATAATTPEVTLDSVSEGMASFSAAIRSRALALERARQDETELQAWTLFAASQLRHASNNASFVVETNDHPVAVGWQSLVAPSAEANDLGTTTNPSFLSTTPSTLQTEEESQYRIAVPAGGQHAVAMRTFCLNGTLHRMADLAEELRQQRTDPMLRQEIPFPSPLNPYNTMPDAEPWLQVLYSKLQELSQYHAEHPAAPSIEEGGSQVLAATIRQWSSTLDALYTAEEVMGKYLDLKNVYDTFMRDCATILHASHPNTDAQTVLNTNGKRPVATTTTSSSYSYIDFVRDLSKAGSGGLAHWSETEKLQHRRKYLRWLTALREYLESFLQRTVPLLSIASLQHEATAVFRDTWSRTGGAPPSWSAKPAEAHLAATLPLSTDVGDGSGIVEHDKKPSTDTAPSSIDLSLYETAQDLADRVDGDLLKVELSRLGLKCGGTVADRAARLFLLKHQSLQDLPAKLFKIKPPPQNATDQSTDPNDKDVISHTPMTKLERRIDIAHLEAIVSTLLGQLGPVLEATLRRAERRQTQTLVEREREVEDELYKSNGVVAPRDQQNGHDEDDDDEDAPIYNPKNVPLDFDGKPIPYWLFKLHGLNHYYPCEICGGESYRGRRNFELHFGETRHAAGMRSLGIPNTKHFHGVTKIEDAQELWSILQKKFGTSQQQQMYGGWNEEEYEDSQGNVLSRSTYEDLARQNLL